MDNVHKGVIALMKAAVTGSAQPLPEGFELSAATEIIRRHHIGALAYEGAVLCGIDSKEATMQSLFKSYCMALMHSERQLREVERICAAFEAAGIDYMLLKGCNMKKLYPKSELRAMGDADILIRLGQYEQIKPVMEALGFEEMKEWYNTYNWKSPSLLLELHKEMIPACDKDYYEYYLDIWEKVQNRQGHEYCMSAEDETVFLLTHFAKHFRSSGIGIRHVLDMWVWLHSKTALNEAHIRRELEKLRLWDFYTNVRHLTEYWFESGEADEAVQWMSGFVLSGGSWGDELSGMLSGAIRDGRHSENASAGKAAHYLRRLFPTLTTMQSKWAPLKRFPWLLPFAWIVRAVYKVIFDRKRVKHRAQLFSEMNSENIDHHKKMLNMVGLDYNF